MIMQYTCRFKGPHYGSITLNEAFHMCSMKHIGKVCGMSILQRKGSNFSDNTKFEAFSRCFQGRNYNCAG